MLLYYGYAQDINYNSNKNLYHDIISRLKKENISHSTNVSNGFFSVDVAYCPRIFIDWSSLKVPFILKEKQINHQTPNGPNVPKSSCTSNVSTPTLPTNSPKGQVSKVRSCTDSVTDRNQNYISNPNSPTCNPKARLSGSNSFLVNSSRIVNSNNPVLTRPYLYAVKALYWEG